MDDNGSKTSYINADNAPPQQQQQCQPVGTQAQPAAAPPAPAFYRICGCIECYNPSREVLDYDFGYDDTSGKKPAQAYPRIRERGEYYIDSFNGEAWSCSFGTAEQVRLWNMNTVCSYRL
jgi:hypothetical protein